jgi:exodeoxyribonuclease III
VREERACCHVAWLPVRLATWNVNSIRSRADRVAAWLERSDVDVVALQETKCRDDQFPEMIFNALGYEVAHVGHSQWNGVAILSRVGIEDVAIGFPGMPSWSSKEGQAPAPEARALGATCGGVRVWSLYVPNGRTLADPHLQYKLQWLEALRTTASGWLVEEPAAPIALVGDWNIAPENDDVWDMAVFAHSTHVSPPERAAFRAIVDAGYADVVRPYTPGPGVYTYWDYTQLRFPRREGMRIDFVLGSPSLAARVTNALIDRQERKGKGASDHAPVIVELAD